MPMPMPMPNQTTTTTSSHYDQQPATIIYHGNPHSTTQIDRNNHNENNQDHPNTVTPNTYNNNNINDIQNNHNNERHNQQQQQQPNVVEYVAEYSSLNQANNNNDNNHNHNHNEQQQQQHQQNNAPQAVNEPTQTYEVAGQPELGTVYLPAASAEPIEPYGGNSSPENNAHSSQNPSQTTPSFYPEQQQQQQQQRPSLAWSPSVASEHEQHQQSLELAEYNVQMQPLEGMPATAGYNNFFQPTPAQSNSYENQQQPQQQQHQEMAPPGDNHSRTNVDGDNNQHNGQKWRSKAGGSAPNPGK